MTRQSFLPSTDAGLLAWSNNFSTRVSAAPLPLGISVLQAAAYATLDANFSAAMAIISDPGTKTHPAILAKNDARSELKQNARLLASIIEGQSSVTDEQKAALGLTVRSAPTSILAPIFAPGILIDEVLGHLVSGRLVDPTNTNGHSMPAGVATASIFSFVGAEAPLALRDWTYEGATTRAKFSVQFGSEIAQGAKIWIASYYSSPRQEPGPLSAPVSAFLQLGAVTRGA